MSEQPTAKILVVDNTRESLRFLAETLSSQGYTVWPAGASTWRGSPEVRELLPHRQEPWFQLILCSILRRILTSMWGNPYGSCPWI